MRAICLLSDFGLEDHYVGAMHAVCERDAPGAPRLDLGHAVPAGDVWTGCFFVRSTWPHLPEAAVVLAVVDPGVGTARRAVAAAIAGRWLVAPDNGLAAAVGPAERVIQLDAAAMGLAVPSATFHGRDLFAPAAARLARGDDPSRLGSDCPADGLVPCPLPEPTAVRGRLHGVVLHVDRFGNVITNLPAAAAGPGTALDCGSTRVRYRAATYSEAPTARPVFLAGSSGLLELAVRDGSAAERLTLKRGDEIVLAPAETM